MELKNIIGDGVNLEEVEVIINDTPIHVKQYLPSAEKVEILNAIFSNADAGTVVNSLAVDILFDLYVVFEYSDIEFTDEDRADLFALYDRLECNGIIDAVVSAIPEEEYNVLLNNANKIYDEYLGYRDSARAVFEQMSIFAPKSAETLKENIQDFDIEKMQEVLAIAKSAGLDFEK